MLIKTCFQCEFHEVKQTEEKQMSYCSKENCWSEFSKCLSKHALKIFLERESEMEKELTSLTSCS